MPPLASPADTICTPPKSLVPSVVTVKLATMLAYWSPAVSLLAMDSLATLPPIAPEMPLAWMSSSAVVLRKAAADASSTPEVVR